MSNNLALDEWFEKTNWVQEKISTFPIKALGKHRADIMREEIERLRKNQEDVKELLGVLIDLVRATHDLLDDTEESGPAKSPVLTIEPEDFDAVSKILDKLDELPDDKPGYTMGPATKTEWALRELIGVKP